MFDNSNGSQRRCVKDNCILYEEFVNSQRKEKVVAEPKDPTEVGQEGNKLNVIKGEVDLQNPKGSKEAT